MAIGKWTEEELKKKIEINKKSILELEKNWNWYVEQRIKNKGETVDQANAWLKFSHSASAESIGRCYTLLGNGKEAKEWFKTSAEKRFESMSLTYFHDTESLRMLWTAVLSHERELAQIVASKMLSSGVVAKLRSDFVKKQCELYANIILNKNITQEYLNEMEEIEGKQYKKISGVAPGSVKSCHGIVERNKNLLIEGLSTMLPFTRRFYGQMKGDVPVAMEEVMIILLAKGVGIDVGPENFPKYKEMLPACLFEYDN